MRRKACSALIEIEPLYATEFVASTMCAQAEAESRCCVGEAYRRREAGGLDVDRPPAKVSAQPPVGRLPRSLRSRCGRTRR